jgi:hypothetical protein
MNNELVGKPSKSLKEVQAELAAKRLASVASITDGRWSPTQSRMRVKKLEEVLSSIIEIAGQKKELYVRVEVLELGPLTGYERIGSNLEKTPAWIKSHDYSIGDQLLVTFNSLVDYKDVNGNISTFLKGEEFVIAHWVKE